MTEPLSNVINEERAVKIALWIDNNANIYSISNNPYKLLLRGSRNGFTHDLFWDERKKEGSRMRHTIALAHKFKEPGKWKPIWKVPSKEVATIFDGATRTRISETGAGKLDDMTFGGEGPPTWPPESYWRKRTYVLELGTSGRKTIVAPNAG
ncbi:hypothetical protein C2G38_2164904 [Gigaspora rosea]|uniref:Uncharacterized protein n=1 Tax=Gigaspora rosea TaxID=44941 RepID=A0A397VVP3_9GLOM|nr:hypothetical protein C2G38_2164904 [Gigaspora rosea]